MGSEGWSRCAHCGTTDGRAFLDGTPLCDRCLNDWIRAQTGWPRLPDPPPGEESPAADGDRDAGAGAQHATTDEPSIDAVLLDFLADQQARLAESTYRRYERTVGLLRHCLNAYGDQWLAGEDAARWQEAFDAGEHDAFTRVCRPERILDSYGEFLGYFMLRKGATSRQDLRAAATVTKKLARWLTDHGYVDPQLAVTAHGRAALAGRELPRAYELGEHLFDLAQNTHLPVAPTEIAADDWVEDHLPITRVEDGQLWVGDIGPLAVPTATSDLAEVGWDLSVVLARVAGQWRLVQVGTVYP